MSGSARPDAPPVRGGGDGTSSAARRDARAAAGAGQADFRAREAAGGRNRAVRAAESLSGRFRARSDGPDRASWAREAVSGPARRGAGAGADRLGGCLCPGRRRTFLEADGRTRPGGGRAVQLMSRTGRRGRRSRPWSGCKASQDRGAARPRRATGMPAEGPRRRGRLDRIAAPGNWTARRA